jgi:hypothetical protein
MALMIKTTITANEARALSKNPGCTDLNSQPYITRMFDEIRQQAKIGKTKMYVDLIEYAYHFNQSLTHPSYMRLMEHMEMYAENAGFICQSILQKGEYLFLISWAEEK